MIDEPLAESSAWLDAIAPWTCRRSEDNSCAWYHGTWQYLRMLGLVSTPAWHAVFFTDALQGVTGGAYQPRILVSGCADYGLYAHALVAVGGRVPISVLDWCPTPLAATAWYARRAQAPLPELLCADATAHRPVARYDAIVSDAFLPRFSPGQLRALLHAWRVSLKPGGRAITTVRIHDSASPSSTSAEAIAAQWIRVARAAETSWSRRSTLPVDELVARVEAFADRQERNAIYRSEDVAALFVDAGFTEVEIDIAEHGGRKFAQVIAR